MKLQDELYGDRPVQENVVPAYPYDDALSSLFHNSIVGANREVKRPSGMEIRYTADLFPKGTEKLHSRAAAVACLFENIILAPRGIELPDIESYTKSGVYAHPDLRLQMPFEAPPQFEKFRGWVGGSDDYADTYTEWDHLEGIAMRLGRRRAIKAFFNRHKALFPKTSYIEFTINTIVELHLARTYNAVVLGNDVFHEFYRLLRVEAPAEMELFPGTEEQSTKLQRLELSDLEALSLDFSPATLDTFAAVRMDQEIREYGRNWRRIIATSPPESLLANLLTEMARANESSNIARKTAGIFSFVSTFLTWLGLVPLAGPVSAVGGIATDLALKAAGKVEKRLNWSMVGAKMHSVANQANLKQYLSQKRQVRR